MPAELPEAVLSVAASPDASVSLLPDAAALLLLEASVPSLPEIAVLSLPDTAALPLPALPAEVLQPLINKLIVKINANMHLGLIFIMFYVPFITLF
jgi:hypothetical protein